MMLINLSIAISLFHGAQAPYPSAASSLIFPSREHYRLRGYVDHPTEYNITVGQFEKILPTENRVSTDRDGKERTLGVYGARFKVLDSSSRRAGESIDVVWIGREIANASDPPLAQPPVGQRYFLATRSSERGRLVEKVAGRTSKDDLVVTKSIPGKSPDEELAHTILMTDADHLEGGATPSERIMWSASDCLIPKDIENRIASSRMLEAEGYPDPPYDNRRPNTSRKPQPANPVTDALRQEARNADPDLEVTILQVLDDWGMDNTGTERWRAVAKCAKDPNAIIPDLNLGNSTANSASQRLTPKQYEDITVEGLDGAVNKDVIEALLAVTTPEYTLAHDRRLTGLLDSPVMEIRYAVCRHFSESRKRPDLKPQEPDFAHPRHVEGRPIKITDAYIDTDEKVAAWKQFFGTS